MQSAAVYELGDRTLIHPWRRTTVSLGLASEPFSCLPLAADLHALGDAWLNALSPSGKTVPHPPRAKGLSTPRLKAAGTKPEKWRFN